MENTQVCVVGGGPAGMMLGLLLARAGVRVTVLEKHADFLRDFRGDTVHPSTLTLLDELGLMDRFNELPHNRISSVVLPGPDGPLTVGSLGRLKVAHPYIAMVPQWDLLDMLAEAAQKEPTFTLLMNTECTDVIREHGVVRGVRYRTADGRPGEIRATLTVATDGRWSTVRRALDMRAKDIPVPFDAWWFRLGLPPDSTPGITPTGKNGKFAVVFPRRDYLQVAYLGPKGSDARLRAAGIAAFRDELRELYPEAGEQIDALTDMDDVKFLSVRLDRLRTWHRAGVLCIGDAAHAMSPMGGVGINLAVQDAVATAAVLARPLLRGTLRRRDLARVQARRWLPTLAVQWLQELLHSAVIGPVMAGRRNGIPTALPTVLRRFPALAVIPARLIGVGLRPEHAPDYARRAA